MSYRLIDAERTRLSVSQLCRVFGVSRAGYYAWKTRPPSARAAADQQLLELIGQLYQRSRGTYGAPRIHAELRLDHGIYVGANEWPG